MPLSGQNGHFSAIAPIRSMAEKEMRMADDIASALSLDFIKQQIVEFIGTNFLYDGNMLDLGENTSLLENGILDQTGALELVLFLEDTYGFAVPESDLTPENLDSISNIANYIHRRLGAR
jgi:acyl carrier protein